MKEIIYDQTTMAMRLAMVVKRLRVRLREATPASAIVLPISQISILQRLNAKGPATAASLATAEHVSQQAIAQSLNSLKQAGLVQAMPDPTDGRKSLISVTDAGHRLFESVRASRNAWLVQAIDSTIGNEELLVLEKAIELLERLADADPLKIN